MHNTSCIITIVQVKHRLIELVNQLFRTVLSGVGGKGVIQQK